MATSAGYTATATGTDYWVATYNGDSNNAAVSSGTALEPVSITTATPAINTTQQPASATVGSSIADKATVSGGDNPTGTVTFNLYSNSGGTGTPLFTDTETLSGGMATSAGYTATATGTDYWVATYNGDSNNAAVSSGTALEPVSITTATPAINTTQQAAATVGTSIADQATVSGGYNPTGTVTFNLYNNSTATGTPLFSDAETLSSGMATSKGYIAAATGTDYWVATYNGDSNNSAVSSGTASEPVTITGAPNVTVTKTADQATIVAGQTAGFVVTITNNGTAAATGLTLSDPLPPGAYNDVNWKIDTTDNTGNFKPGDFTITGTTPNQNLTLASTFNGTLAVGQAIAVHITGVTTTNDTGTSTNPALGVAGQYAVLYEGTGGHNLSISNVTVNGNVGVGGTGVVQFSGPGTIGGRLDFSAANAGQYHNTNGSNVGPTSVNYSVATVTTALSTVNSLSSSLAGLGNSLAINGTQSINESAGLLDTVNGVTYRIFNVTSYSENNGNVVTINGDGSGDPVVFNFGFNSNVNLGGDVTLTGGLTPDQVVWNFTTTGKNINLNNNASSYPLPLAFQGVLLAPNDAMSLVNANLDGHVFGGNSSDMQIVSGDTINVPTTTGTLPNTATVGATGDTGKPGEQASATVTLVSSISPCCNLTGISYSLTPPGGTATTATVLRGSTVQGETVSVTFTVPSGDYDQLSLVSYVAPQSSFSASSAYLQQVYQSVTQVFGPGQHTLGPVTIPSSYYQIDFVCGTVISQLGLSPNDFYSAQSRLIDADNAGTTVPAGMAGSTVGAGQTAAPSFWTSTAAGKGQALIDSLNGGASATNLGNWLATVSPNLLGSLLGDTNTQIASYVKSLSSSSAKLQVLATALAAYVTDSSLAGTVATSYGFTVTPYGTGVDTYNVGTNGSALGLSNNTVYSIVTLLAALDAESSNGVIGSSATSAANTVFTNINKAGGIS